MKGGLNMDRILSARIDDAIYRKINDLAEKMHKSKKSVIETAVKLLGRQFEQDKDKDIFDETCGIWNRSESPGDTVSDIKAAFRQSMNRHRT